MTGFNLYDINFWFGVVGILSAIIPFVTYLLKRKSYEISLHAEGFNKIINDKNDSLKGFRLLYNSAEIIDPTKVYTFNCFLQNTGTKDIGSDLIKTPIKIIIPKTLKIISATTIDYPEQIQSLVNFDSANGELLVQFDLLQTGEVIKIQLVVELGMEISIDKIWTIWRQIDVDFRIKNIKSIPWRFVSNRTHASLLRETLLSVIVIPAFIILTWVIFNHPYKLTENRYLTEFSIDNRQFYGDIFFINNDTIGILFIDGNRIDTVMSRSDFFNLAKVKRRIRRKATDLPETKIILIGVGLLLIPMAHTPYRRYRLRRMLDRVQKK